MSRYIDADGLGSYMICSNPDDEYALGWNNAITKIETNAPTADVAPIVHARWIICNRLENNRIIDDNEFFRCSLCFHDVKKKTCYCSNCGAKMDKETEE